MILILTEAGDGIGFGHLTRTMALGEALIEGGATVQLLVQWEGEPMAQVVEGRTWVRAGSWRDTPVHADQVIIDSYRLSLAGYEAIANAGGWLGVIDDNYRLPYPADLVINPNVYAETARYSAHARRAIGGAPSVILRPPFVAAAGTFAVRATLRRVLLTLGGADVHGLGPQLAQHVASLGFFVDCIAPGRSPERSPSLSIHSTQGAEGFVQLVTQSDLVICGGGQTLHELACLGTPSIAVELGNDQKLNLDFYEHAGCQSTRLHWSQPDLIEALTARLHALAPAHRRQDLADRGTSLIDGAGATRLADVIRSSSSAARP
jgi:spore coat polysaccharide biosynthesis predicted glycosyltransferase SpsG